MLLLNTVIWTGLAEGVDMDDPTGSLNLRGIRHSVGWMSIRLDDRVPGYYWLSNDNQWR